MKKNFRFSLKALILFFICTGFLFLRNTGVSASEDVSVWDGSSREMLPMGEGVNEYLIKNAANLASLASDINGGMSFEGCTFTLETDIDLGGNEWIPMGLNTNYYFSGTIDGNGHTIKNGVYNAEISSANIMNAPYHTVGLFGVCKGAEIKNLTVSDMSFTISNTSGYQQSYSSISGTNVYAGGICGYSLNTDYKNVSVTDSTVKAYTGSESAYAYAGGIAGYMKGGDIEYSSSKANTISGTSDSLNNDACCGGLVGEIDAYTLINHSYNTSAVNGGHTMAAANVGGIVGKSSNSADTLSVIRDSYNSGNVTHKGSWSENANVGGIIGNSASTVTRCYNSGNVVANTRSVGTVKCAGIAGNGISSSTVSACVVLCGSISGGSSRMIVSNVGNKENNFARTSITGSPTNDANQCYDVALFKDKAYFETLSWDFDKIWEEKSGSFPVLRQVTSERMNDEDIVNEAIDSIDIKFAKGEKYDKVLSNVTLGSSPNEAVVTWSSSCESVISSVNGNVTRPESDFLVTLIASISHNKYVVNKYFKLQVIGSNSNADIISSDWAMSVDDARDLISRVRCVPYVMVPADDEAVQVLTGNDVDEEHIKNLLTEMYEFWEIPLESSLIKEKMGDLIGYLKSSEKDVVNDFVSQIPGGNFIVQDGDSGNISINGKTVAKNVAFTTLRIFGKQKDLFEKFDKAFKKSKSVIDSTKDIETTSILDNVASQKKLVGAWGNFFAFSLDLNGKHDVSGLISKIQSISEKLTIVDAVQKTMRNNLSAYVENYVKNRRNFESPDDEMFKIIMAAHKNDLLCGALINVDPDELGENMYQIEQKFNPVLADEFKILVQCPVDVYIYDMNGKLVGKVVNDIVDTTLYDSVKIEMEGEASDEKLISLDKDKIYHLRLVGNDEGSMDLTMSTDEDDISYHQFWDDIELQPGKEMWIEVNYGKIKTREYPKLTTMENGSTVIDEKDADENDVMYEVNIYGCEKNEDNDVMISDYCVESLSGFYKKGTDINDLYSIKDGYKLVGIYTDITCEHEFTESATPEKAVDLYVLTEESEEAVGEILEGYTLSLEDSFIAKFYMKLSDTVLENESSYMLFELENGDEQKVYTSDAEEYTKSDGNILYVYQCRFSPDDIIDTIKARIVVPNSDGDEKNGKVYTYSVRERAEELLREKENNPNIEEETTTAKPEETTEKEEETTTEKGEETTTAKPEETTTEKEEETTRTAKPEETTKAKEETTTAKPEETTKAKEETTTAKQEETTKAKEEETTTAKQEETTKAKEEETTTAKVEETTATKPEETTTTKVEETTTSKEEETTTAKPEETPSETTVETSSKKHSNSITGTFTYEKTSSTKTQSFTLDIKVKGGNVTYKSENSNVKVSSKGKVTIAKKFVGTVKITVTAGDSNYKAVTKTITVKVVPASTKITTVKNSANGKITVKWSKIKNVTGYQIQYSTSASFDSNKKTVLLKSSSMSGKVISKVEKGKTYFIRIRTYKKVSGRKVYSEWSTKKKLKITK